MATKTSTRDLRNQPFGHWRVMHRGQTTAHGPFWCCYCVCTPAVIVELAEQALLEGWTQSCGCEYHDSRGRHAPRVDLIGRQCGSRLIRRYIPGKTRAESAHYECWCLCGHVGVVQTTKLLHGRASQCISCKRKKVLSSRWYGDVFVEKIIGTDNHGKLLYRCHFPNQKVAIFPGSEIRRGNVTGEGHHPNQGVLVQNAASVLPWLSAGVSQAEIARRLGVSPGGVTRFLARHPEIQALAASFAPDEDLVAEVGRHGE